jgi:hypothetical protein
LNEEVFEKAKQFFFNCKECKKNLKILRERSQEFTKMEKQKKEDKEFFLNVNDKGSVVYPPDLLIKEFITIQRENRTFGNWFRKDEYKDRTVLLIARWLSHFIGFRHRCAHIFLDHPILKDYTFVQLRSFGKADSPGCFDIPVGGHAKGISTLEETAREELKDELNIDLQHDIEGFYSIGDYSYYEPPKRPDFHNIEHRTAFCGHLNNKAMPKIKFCDGEVAAMCVFSISELKILLKKFPERAASGLVGSFHIYIKHKKLRARNSR